MFLFFGGGIAPDLNAPDVTPDLTAPAYFEPPPPPKKERLL